ncbi:hypothetical protein P3X46_002328 [Hevea brasiliensis]|uniref:Secreted protein n=1 Tax=Hevea brasiliensis TaxID=3981 RepID=A0ABQ9N3P3_HEVBR|nr:hypothetical protein P3X46_002328 [Hevea brasiliensis]
MCKNSGPSYLFHFTAALAAHLSHFTIALAAHPTSSLNPSVSSWVFLLRSFLGSSISHSTHRSAAISLLRLHFFFGLFSYALSADRLVFIKSSKKNAGTSVGAGMIATHLNCTRKEVKSKMTIWVVTNQIEKLNMLN